MTTTTRIRAGTVYGCAFKDCPKPAGPCAGNCQLRRVDASQLTDNLAVMVACEPSGKYANSPMPYDDISVKPGAESAADVKASDRAFWSWSLLMWTFICFGIGWMSHRFFS